MPRFSGTRRAPFAPSVRRNQRGSQVWRRMFSRPYRYSCGRALLTLLKDKDANVRAEMANVLGKIGDKSTVNPLLENLTDWYSNVNVIEALSKLGWEPQSDEERVHFLVAKREGLTLRENWSLTKTVLLKDVQSPKYHTIENALFAFIGIGNTEILPELIKTMNTKGNKIMAEAFLNCHHPELDITARDWVARHGYSISVGPGAAPINWGAM
jgi:HEAT repeats